MRLATGVLTFGGYLAMRRMLRPVGALARHMDETDGAPRPDSRRPISRSGDTGTRAAVPDLQPMTGAVEARAEAERRLAERERFVSLGRLSSSLAHEINNPLGGLLNATDTIRTYADRPEVVRQSADLMRPRPAASARRGPGDAGPEPARPRPAQPLTPEDFDDLRLLFEPEGARPGQIAGLADRRGDGDAGGPILRPRCGRSR